MKRRALKITFVLLAGVFLTYAVAWSFAVVASWRDAWKLQSAIIYDASQEWLWPPPADWPHANAGSTSTAFACEYVQVSYADALKPQYSLRVAQKTQHRHRLGWPLRALESRQATELLQAGAPFTMTPRPVPRHVWVDSLEAGVNMAGNGPQGYINLPIMPRWPHFALSVGLYALLPWGLFKIPSYLRRAWRRHGARCERCGYELGGLASCPECGAVRASRSRAAPPTTISS